jgi:GNAT superfamily N-acetyltransferase
MEMDRRPAGRDTVRMSLAQDLRRARAEDVPFITSCVCEAYLHYIERLGKQPSPMLKDYAHVVRCHEVWVAGRGAAVDGVVVLVRAEDGFWLENIAVRPSSKGTGLGRLLLAHALRQAQRAGFDAVQLYTHELMTENRAWYERSGFAECDRSTVDGYARVYYRKELAA